LSRAVIAGSLLLFRRRRGRERRKRCLRLYPAGYQPRAARPVRSVAAHPQHRRAHRAISHPDLPEERFTTRATSTEVWCGFFINNAAISIWSALAASREVWAVYNGFIATWRWARVRGRNGCCADTSSRTRGELRFRCPGVRARPAATA